MNFSSKTAKNDCKQLTCNAINCYYSNEYMYEADYETSAQNISQCAYCSYNYDRLHNTKMLINTELKRFPSKRKNNISSKFYELIFSAITILAVVLMIIYIFLQTKQLIR